MDSSTFQAVRESARTGSTVKGGGCLVLRDHESPHDTTGAAIATHGKAESLLHEPRGEIVSTRN